jgi:NAD(P)-dependent dehydrogenase (short-subunit alcohol dehydrogenase family)
MNYPNKLSEPLFDLSGKVVLITGAAGLLGVEHVIALIQSGADVVMTDVNLEALKASAQKVLEVTGINPMIMLVDVSDQDSVLLAQKELATQGKTVTILINNAAIDPKVQKDSMVETSRLENFSVDDWDFQIKVGLTGAMLCSKVFGTEMAKNGSGVILNIASDLSIFAPDQRLYKKDGLLPEQQPVKPVTYSVIKHGLIGLTKYLASYWADQGVRCNALSPGGVYTSQDEELMHTVSTYPMKVENANLNVIHTLRKKYKCNVGYSGHEVGLAPSYAASALGITSLERHISLDRTMYGSDQSASVELHGFTVLVNHVRAIEKAMGDGEKRILEEEVIIADNLRQHLKKIN